MRSLSDLSVLAGGLLLFLLPSCESEDSLVPQGEVTESPCFSVNLLDGLDEEEPGELINFFDCLNSTGNLSPLSPFFHLLPEERGSGGEPLSRDAAILFNELWKEDYLSAFLHYGASLLSIPESTLARFVLSISELIYGVPFSEIEDSITPPPVEEGVMYSLLPPLLVFSSSILEDGEGIMAPLFYYLSSLTGSDDFKHILETLSILGEEEDAVGEVVYNTGIALGSITEEGGGENLLFPFLESLIGPSPSNGENFLSSASDDLSTLLGDERITSEGISTYLSLHESSALAGLPSGISYLMSVDRDGGALNPNENSALLSLLLMNSAGNGPVSCWYLDLFGLDTSNLSVSILETLATYDAGSIESAINWLGGYAEYILRIANYTGCDIPGDVVENISAINRLTESGVLDSLVPILHYIYGGSQATSRIPEVVNILDRFYQYGGAGAVEPLYLSTPSSLFTSFMELLYLYLLESGEYVDSFHNILYSVFSPISSPQYGESPAEVLASPILEMITGTPDELDLSLYILGGLLTADSTLSALLSSGEFGPIDPSSDLLGILSTLLSRERFHSSLMEIFSSEPLVQEAMKMDEEREGVLPFFGRITSDGTILDIINFLILIIEELEECTGYEF